MIVVTVFLSILNQIKFHLVQNRKESDQIPFNVKGNLVFSVKAADVYWLIKQNIAKSMLILFIQRKKNPFLYT